MNNALTFGIKVSVIPEYQPFYSKPDESLFAFSYTITIENFSDFTVKLLRRHWYIYDSYGASYEIEGDGVVGLNPVIEPKQSFEYTSGCTFASTIGKMHGIYLMERIRDGKIIEVTIPEFLMQVPYILN